MKVEIWSDIICPWCGIGDARLGEALRRFEHGDEVELVHRSFQLDESAPVGQTQTVRDMLRKKMGASPAQVETMTRQVEQIAAADGIQPYHVSDNIVGNTSLAHELAAWADEQGRGAEVWDALFKAYFQQARSIFDVEALVALAEELGLDGAGAREALDTRRYEARVLAEGREARQLGARGVPFVVIDRKYAVAGAQPLDVFVKTLERAWADRPALIHAPEGAVCDDAGCALPDEGESGA